MVTISAKVPEEALAGIRRGRRSAWLRDAIREKAEREQRPAAPTQPGKPSALLTGARAEYQAAGGRLLSFSEAAAEMAHRRGER